MPEGVLNRNGHILFPARPAFAVGHYGRGMLLLAMQVSLVLWPLAVRMAKKSDAAQGVQSLLDTLSDQHRRADPAAPPEKRFRPRGARPGGT
jgi:hypothetical protein